MEREETLEVIEYLREHLTVGISINNGDECGNEYITCYVSIQLDGEEITSDCDSVCVNN